MTPYEAIRDQFVFPFELRQYQIDKVNAGCADFRHALYWEPGSGKTAGSTHWALYHRLNSGYDQWVITMPPILLEQWRRWITSVRWKHTGAPLTATVYAGTPAERRKLSLKSDFILTSYGLLKNDYERIYTYFQGKRVGLVNDEATAIKNIESDNHQANKDFAEGRPYQPLTGTPITKLMDAYAYIRLLTGDLIYRNKRAFERLHVEEFDAYDRPVAYKNIDVLGENMKVQSSRILRREVQAELPPVIFSQVPYLLAPKHIELYNRIAKEKLIEFENGGVIDAISAQKLRMTLQQMVVNWPYFGQDERLRPAILDLIDEALEEIGNRKLVVVANFRRSNAYLLQQLQQYGAVAIYGDVGTKGRQEALTNFLHNDACRAIILHPQSAGFGVDGLQHVCSEMLVVECPTTPPEFHQVLARLDRDGQREPVNCRIAVAQRTSQVRLFRDLLANDALINTVQGGFQDLKDSIYGN
jgi:hypothetical protein